MMKKIFKVILGWGVTEHNASIQPTLVLDSGWQKIFFVTEVMFVDFDLRINKEEADIHLPDFLRH